MYSYGPPHMAGQKQDNQLEHTFSSYVRIRDVALKTYQRRWTIGRSGERGSGISVLVAWHDDVMKISLFRYYTKRSVLFLMNCKTLNAIWYWDEHIGYWKVHRPTKKGMTMKHICYSSLLPESSTHLVHSFTNFFHSSQRILSQVDQEHFSVSL